MLPLQALEKGLISTFWWTFNTHQIPAVRRKTHLSSQRRAPIYCRCWEADAALRKTSGCIAFLSCTDLPAHTRRKQYRETAAALTQQHSHVGGAWKQKPFKVQGEAPCFPVNNMLLWTFLRLYEDFLGFFFAFLFSTASTIHSKPFLNRYLFTCCKATSHTPHVRNTQLEALKNL